MMNLGIRIFSLAVSTFAKVGPSLTLKSDDGVPIAQLKDRLTFYPGPTHNYWKGFLSNNPRRLRVPDGEIIQQALQEKVTKRHPS